MRVLHVLEFNSGLIVPKRKRVFPGAFGKFPKGLLY